MIQISVKVGITTIMDRGGGGGGGGGHSVTEGGRTRVTYFAEEGVFFKTSAFQFAAATCCR